MIFLEAGILIVDIFLCTGKFLKRTRVDSLRIAWVGDFFPELLLLSGAAGPTLHAPVLAAFRKLSVVGPSKVVSVVNGPEIFKIYL